LKARDVIVELDEQPVRTAADLAGILTTLHAGTRHGLIYVRDGQRMPTELPIV
jgi:S1-C subfamily serine protease